MDAHLYVATSQALQKMAIEPDDVVFKIGWATNIETRQNGLNGLLDGKSLDGVNDWNIQSLKTGDKDEIIRIEKLIHNEFDNYKEYFIPIRDFADDQGSGHTEVYCLKYGSRADFIRAYNKSENPEFRQAVLFVREKFGLVAPKRKTERNVVTLREDDERR